MKEGEDEITSTSILNTSAQIWGIFLVALMDIAKNNNSKFTMESSNWLLFSILVCGAASLWMVNESEVMRKVNVDDEYVEISEGIDRKGRSSIGGNDNDGRSNEEELNIIEAI